VTTAGVTAGTLYGISIDAITGSTGAETALNVGTGWDQGLTIADANTNAILLSSTDGDGASGVTFGSATPVYVYRSAAGELTISDNATTGSGNYFQFDTVNGPTYAGTARPIKTITLRPEYAGAVLTTFNGSSADGSVTGTMTSSAETSGYFRNYYQWFRSQTTQNYYTVAVRATLPQDFSSWSTNTDAIIVNYYTTDNTSGNALVDVRINVENSGAVDLTNNTGLTSNGSWTTFAIDESNGIDNTTSVDWDTAGQTAVIYLRMGSQSSNVAQIGDITLKYYAKF